MGLGYERRFQRSGSVLSMTIAIQFGLGVTLICGALTIVLGWAMTNAVGHRSPSTGIA